MRKQGLACDHLVSADVVTADGRLVRAGADGDPELLWGLRGGGGNFGVVTALELDAPAGRARWSTAGSWSSPATARPTSAAFYADWTAGGLPDELTTILNLTTAPPAPFLPESIHGKPVAIVAACYAGPADEGERALAPVRGLGDPVADLFGPLPYVAMQQLLDPLWGRGARNHMKAGYLADLGSGAIDALLRGWEAKPSPMSELHVHHMGGAAARAARATARPSRTATRPYVVNFISRWTDAETDDEQIGWGRDVYASLAEHTTGGAYINFLSDEGHDRVRAAYGDEAYGRLQALKRNYDPDNAFHRNQNVVPALSTSTVGGRSGVRLSRRAIAVDDALAPAAGAGVAGPRRRCRVPGRSRPSRGRAAKAKTVSSPAPAADAGWSAGRAGGSRRRRRRRRRRWSARRPAGSRRRRRRPCGCGRARRR